MGIRARHYPIMQLSIPDSRLESLLTLEDNSVAAIPSGHLHTLLGQHVVLHVPFFSVLFEQELVVLNVSSAKNLHPQGRTVLLQDHVN